MPDGGNASAGTGGARSTLSLPVDLRAHPHAAARAIAQAAALLRDGRLVAFPTETVYGLGADATNADAVADIFAAKARPYSDPLIVHIADATWLDRVVSIIPPQARLLAEHFWPGPLTLVLPRADAIPPIVAAGGATVGVRVPDHPVALALIRATDRPVAAPSANRFLHTSPTTAAHVLDDLDGRIDCVLDGGPCAVGVESTVLDLTSSPPRILRPGGVTLEALQALLPDVQGPREQATTAAALAAASGDGISRAPGQFARHYAPHTPLVVFAATGEAGLAAVATEAQRALMLGQRVGALLPDEEAPTLEAMGAWVERMGPADDLAQITRRLYAALRALDDGSCDLLLAHTFGRAGLALALEDRLRRAASGDLRQV